MHDSIRPIQLTVALGLKTGMTMHQSNTPPYPLGFGQAIALTTKIAKEDPELTNRYGPMYAHNLHSRLQMGNLLPQSNLKEKSPDMIICDMSAVIRLGFQHASP